MINYYNAVGIGLLIYFVVSAITVWAVVKTEVHWSWRALMLISLPYLGFIIYWASINLQGWPIAYADEKGQVMAIKIIEPNPAIQDKGAINFWIMQEEENRPRAFFIPYSKEAHKKLVEMMKQQQGQRGSRMRAKGKGKGKPVQGSGEESLSRMNLEIQTAYELLPKGD